MKIFSYDEALTASLKYFANDELAAKVFVDKYALRNGLGKLVENNPDQMHRRIAREFARIEKNKFNKPLTEDEIYSYLKGFKKIVPQGSPMYGIGNPFTYHSLGNCFTLDMPYDSYGGILYTDQQLVQLMKRRCGVGIRLDKIRPKGLITQNAARSTDGIGVFMERFSNSTREVAQGGRRGACLMGLSIHHPEIETFINIKKNKEKVTGANISVIITDEFMQALKNNKDYEQRFPLDSNKPYIINKISAKTIWNKIIKSVYISADPGILFIDNAQKYSLSHCYGEVDSRFKDNITNPCGEIWMGQDSCRLLLINLFSFVKNPFSNHSYFSMHEFKKTCNIAQRLMDNMIDLEIECMNKIITKINNDPEPEYIKNNEKMMWNSFKEVAELGRRTGLGITGLGDCLAALNIQYGSHKAIKRTEQIYKTLAIESMRSSCNMARELGHFPLYNTKLEENNIFLNRILKEDDNLKELHNKYGRRNISLTTTSPAGTVSLLTKTTSGIEPAFALKYIRRRKINKDTNKDAIDFTDTIGDTWEEHTVYHHHLQTWMDISKETDIDKSPYSNSTANAIDWKKSIELQAKAQKWISHSISKTCNVPEHITENEIDIIYRHACELGLKGFTLYRDKCKDGVLITNQNKQPEKRPRELECDVHHLSVQGKPYFVLVGKKNGKPHEVFAGLNGDMNTKTTKGRIIRVRKNRYKAILEDSEELCPVNFMNDDTEDALTRLTSTALQAGCDIQTLVQRLERTTGSMTTFTRAIARSLKKYIPDGLKEEGNCPECQSANLRRESGCIICGSCGFSACS